MALSYRNKKRLALFILVIGLPVYIVLAVTLVGLIERPSLWLELAIYIGIGLLWIFPLKKVFLGVGQADPDQGD